MVESGATAVVRRATPNDADAVAGLWTEAYFTRGVGGRSKPYARSDFFDSARHGEVFVSDGSMGIAGAVVLVAPDKPGQLVAETGEAELSRLAVAYAVRGGGIGRALARFCEDRARTAGWQSIALWSRPAQVEAHHLYKSLGYHRLPERDTVDETGHHRLVFRKKITV